MGITVTKVVTIAIVIAKILDVIIYITDKLKEAIEKLRKIFRNRNKSRRELIEEYNLQQIEENERRAERNRSYYNKW